jgi:hypothetical protein
MINSCDNLLRLCRCSRSFVLQIVHVIHDVTSVQGAPRCLHLTTKNVVPESLELLAWQWLRKKITDHVVGPAVFNLRVPLLYLIGYKEITNV